MAMEIDYTLLAKRLSKIRRSKGLTQAQLAEMSNLTNNYISNIETSHSIPSLETLVKLCNALEITPNDLLVGSVQTSSQYLLSDFSNKYSLCTPREKRLIDKFIDAFIEEHQNQR